MKSTQKILTYVTKQKSFKKRNLKKNSRGYLTRNNGWEKKIIFDLISLISLFNKTFTQK